MKNNGQEVSDSDDSELIDDPSPVPDVESTRADKITAEKNLCNSTQQSNCRGNEAISNESRTDRLNSSQNYVNTIEKKKSKSSKVFSVTDKSASLENDTEHVKATFEANDLSSDDEVYIFHCPHDFKKDNLLNQIIDISKSEQFLQAKDGEKYQLKVLSSKTKWITLAVPKKSSKGKLFNFPLKGHMIIQKIVEMENNLMNDLSEIEDPVVFPDVSKTRHPLLGVNWKSYIDSAMDAIEKNHFIKKTKKKIKKEKNEEIIDVQNKKLKRKSSGEIATPKKHKKKA